MITQLVNSGSALPRLTDLQVEVVRDFARFEELKSEWDGLVERSLESVPMLSHTWLASWWKSFGAGMELRVLIARKGQTIVGAAPLALETASLFGGNRRVLRQLANAWVDRSSWLLTEPADDAVKAILGKLGELRSEFDVIQLFPFEEASKQTSAILAAFRAEGWKLGDAPNLQSPYLPMPASYEELLTGLSSSFRQTVKRKVRKAEGMKNITMRVVRDESCIDAIMTISKESWQEDEGTSMASKPEISAFYSAVIREEARKGTLRCALMEVDGEPAAFEFNLRHRNTLHNFKLGFRKKYSELSTGIVLKAFLLQEALDGKSDPGLTEYDFMGTSEPYKLNWAKPVRSHRTTFVFNRSLKMTAVHWLQFVLRPLVRKIRKALWR